MNRKLPGAELALSPRERDRQAKSQYYREILGDREIDTHPVRLDVLAMHLHFESWRIRVVPKNREFKDIQSRHNKPTFAEVRRWRKNFQNKKFVLARRELVKTAFSRLSLRQQVAVAFVYGLLDENALPNGRLECLAQHLQVREKHAAVIYNAAFDTLQTEFNAIVYSPKPLALPIGGPENISIEALDLHERINLRLKSIKVKSLADLEQLDADRLMSLKGLGVKSLFEICQKLKALGRPLPAGTEQHLDLDKIFKDDTTRDSE